MQMAIAKSAKLNEPGSGSSFMAIDLDAVWTIITKIALNETYAQFPAN